MAKKGSITVFSAMCMMLFASFLFALLEAGRAYGLDALADMKSELSLESVCAEYQPYLWENYCILCLDGAYGGDYFSINHVTNVLRYRISENLNPGTDNKKGTNLFQLKLSNAIPDTYQLLTDGDGTVFLKNVASYMKENLPKEAAKIFYDRYSKGKEVEEEGGAEYSVEDADAAIKEAKRERREETDTEQMEETGEVKVEENPLDIVLEFKRNTILGMVIEDVSKVSTQKLNQEDCLSKRECQKGSAARTENVNWYEKVLALEYLDQYFSDYVDPAEGKVLSYEMEYVLCGKGEDKENLEGTVNRLLLMREVANVTHVLRDRNKLNQAFIIANALAGFTGNPAVIRVVQIGIVAAWAYLESIQDVRALLQGNKIALLKSREQWTVDTGHLLESFQSSSKAKNCTNGFSYQEYLKQFLFAMKVKDFAGRMMDIMEQNIRLIPQYKNCKIDHMLCGLSYSMEYESDPLFSRLLVIGNLNIDELRFLKSKSFSYFN